MTISGLKEEYLEDLNYFLDYADTKRGIENDERYPDESFHLNFYFNHSKEELLNFINEFLKQYKVDDDYEFYYFLKCIIKYMSGVYDAHTVAFKKKDNIWFPIKYKIINDSIFIDDCINKNMVKKRIKSINGISIDKVVSEIEKCTSYGTKGWLYSGIVKMLSNKNDILSLPCLHNNNGTIVFETDDNESISFDLNTDYNSVSLSLRKDIEQYRIIDNIFIFKYPACKKDCTPDINKIKTMIENNNIEKFVLDLCGNTGGDSSIINPLIDFLSSNKNLELYTIVDGNVFSSGHWAATAMKKIGSIIVGEQIGTPINAFGFAFGNFDTPNSKINFHFSKVYWYEEDYSMKGIFTKEDLYKQPKEFFEPKYLQIDIPIEITEDEYINSSDDVFVNKCIDLILFL